MRVRPVTKGNTCSNDFAGKRFPAGFVATEAIALLSYIKMAHAQHAYRLVTRDEHDAARTSGKFAGSPLDHRDGYIHLSYAAEVIPTATRYFAGTTLALLRVHLPSVISTGLRVQEEVVASRGTAFPHVYPAEAGSGCPAIPWACIDAAWEVPLGGGTGGWTWPSEISSVGSQLAPN
jgi:uncharacterized protein (DUF952 family)